MKINKSVKLNKLINFLIEKTGLCYYFVMNKIHSELLRRFGRDPKVVFERDGYKCLICGSSENLSIDHIDGNGIHVLESGRKPNNDLDNLRTLCRSCHGRESGKRRGKVPHMERIVLKRGRKKGFIKSLFGGYSTGPRCLKRREEILLNFDKGEVF